MITKERLVEVISKYEYFKNQDIMEGHTLGRRGEQLANIILAEIKPDFEVECDLGSVEEGYSSDGSSCPFCFSVDLPKGLENKKVHISIKEIK